MRGYDAGTAAAVAEVPGIANVAAAVIEAVSVVVLLLPSGCHWWPSTP
jgi:hypothetical protein